MTDDPKQTLSDKEVVPELSQEELEQLYADMPPIQVVNLGALPRQRPKVTLKTLAWGIVVATAWALIYGSLLAWIGSAVWNNVSDQHMSFTTALNYVVLFALIGRAFDLLKIRDKKI